MQDKTLQNNIIGLLRSKNEKGLSLFYDQYGAALNGIVSRVISNEHLAEEVLQTVFLKVWNNFDKYDESKSSLYTWAATIARNASIDVVRLKKNQLANKTEDLDIHVNTFESSQSQFAGIDTNTLMKGLDPKYAMILDYLYLKGYTQQELSDELNIPIGTVKTRLKQAISIIRTNLGEELVAFLSLGFISFILYLLLS